MPNIKMEDMEAEKTSKKQNYRKKKLQNQVNVLVEKEDNSNNEETIDSLKQKLREMEQQLKEATQAKTQDKGVEQVKAPNDHAGNRIEISKVQVETENQQTVADKHQVEIGNQANGGNQQEAGCNPQLFGPNYHEEMVCIGNGIFCRKIIYEMALGGSTRPSSFARKLIEGVYKKEIIVQGTITGQPARAQGKERQLEPVVALHYEARKAIIDHAIKIGEKRKWTVQSERTIQRSMGQSISERKAKERKTM